MQVPFVPSPFVEIRKRMGEEVFEAFHGAIVDAVERKRTKSKASRSDDPDDQDPPPSWAKKADPEKEMTHQGKLILDATVAELAATPALGDPASLCTAVGDVSQQEPSL